MKTKIIVFSFLLIFISLSSSAWALPYLQLDIEGGTYIKGDDETVYALSDVFTLYGLVDSDKGTINDTFYISAALVTDMLAPVNTGGNYGKFSFNGTQYDVTGDMISGTPAVGVEEGNFPNHGIFPTFFTEFSFASFDGRADKYNVEDEWGGLAGGLTNNPSGPLYYAMFAVDTSLLATGYAIHFDFYTKNDDGTLKEFAPFSHDAQSGPPVPEPATILLFGTGLAGLATKLRKKARRVNTARH